MRFPRFRFSVRTLLIAFTVLAALLGVSIRFGPHVVWRMAYSHISTGVVPIPSRPLIAAPPDEILVTCRIGPVSFMLPESLACAVEVHRGIGGAFLVFYDNDRHMIVQLPQPEEGALLPAEIRAFPDKAQQTFPQTYREITAAQSSDFSFGMSRQELGWHALLLTRRALIGDDVDSIEYLSKPDVEGNLVAFRLRHIFQWATTDGQWQGDITFKGASPDDVDWMRQVCATFTIDGDLGVLQNRDDAAIQALINILDADGERERPVRVLFPRKKKR